MRLVGYLKRKFCIYLGKLNIIYKISDLVSGVSLYFKNHNPIAYIRLTDGLSYFLHIVPNLVYGTNQRLDFVHPRRRWKTKEW